MNTPYLAFAGHEETVAGRLPAERLLGLAAQLDMTIVLDRPGLKLLADKTLTVMPFGARSAIVGELFTLDGSRMTEMDEPSAARLASSNGEALFRSSWGRYAAFLQLESGGQAVLRDPSGGLTVYYADWDGLACYFGDIEPALVLGIVRPEIDTLFAAHWLAWPHLRTARTGLAQVRELLPGTRRIMGETGVIDALWDPWTHIREPIADFDEAARRVRETICSTVAALAGDREQILLELSGGLDSSILAAALAQSGAPFACVNFTTGLADGDERRHAAAVARMHGAELIETGIEPAADFLMASGMRRPRPGASVLLGPVDRALSASADARGADALFSGGGGDNIFCFLTTAAPVIDAWRSGKAVAAWDALRDVAELNGCTVWTAARHAMRKARRQASPKAWRVNREFLACAPPPPDPHPWLIPPAGALPGQLEHVEGLALIEDLLDAADRTQTYDMVYPLLAQPVAELCLGIPSWLWVRGGRDRAVARAAFADLLPDLVLHRRTKGRLEGLCAQAFIANRRRIAELLLEGRLQQLGIVDRGEIEAYLATEAIADHRYFRLFDIATLELWLRSWSEG